MDADTETDGEPGGGKLLRDLEIDLVRLVTAAVGGAVRQSEQPRFGEQGEDGTREESRFLLLGRPWGDLLRHDVAYELDELPGLLGGQTAFHRLLGTVGHDGALLPVGRVGGRARGVRGTAGWSRAVPGNLRLLSRSCLPGSREALASGCGASSMPDRSARVTGSREP